MMEFLQDFVNDKVLFFGSIATLLLIIIIIISLVRRSKKLKTLEQIVEKEPLEELEPLKTKIEFSKPPIINIEKKQEVKEEKSEVKDEVKEEKNIEAEAKKEVEEKMESATKKSEPLPVEYKENKNELESMLDQMQADLEKKQSDVSTFEEEQEENSVISYQELLSKMKNKTADKPVESVKEEVKKIEVETPKVELPKVETPKAEVLEKPQIENSRVFRNSEFISPIYGKVNNTKPVTRTRENTIYEKKYEVEENKGNNVELEKTLKMAPISKEIKRNEDFLRALKEFRSNL